LSLDLRITPFVVNRSADTELIDTVVLGTSVVVVTLCRDNTIFASFGVRAQSQPFGLVAWGQFVKVLVKEIFLVGARSGRIFTSVGFQVRAWETDIQSTQRVIYTTREVFTESVLLQADITSTWVLIVTFFVTFTFIFAFASSSSVGILGTISPLSFFAFAVQVSFTFVIAARFLSRFNAANRSVCRLRAVIREVTLISTVWSVRSFNSLATSGFFVANCFEASLGKSFSNFNGCTVKIFLARFNTNIFVLFEGELASFNFVARISGAFFVIITDDLFVHAFEFVRSWCFSDAFRFFASISCFADQVAFFSDRFASLVWVINEFARSG